MKSSSHMVTLTIGQAAARFGLATHVLRHWESMGLLSPERVGDRRRYNEDDLYRIAMVVAGKQVGLSLEDIKAMYQAPDGRSRKEILRQHRSMLLKRMAEAQAALELIDHGIDCRHDDFTQCPNFRRNTFALIRPPQPHSQQ